MKKQFTSLCVFWFTASFLASMAQVISAQYTAVVSYGGAGRSQLRTLQIDEADSITQLDSIEYPNGFSRLAMDPRGRWVYGASAGDPPGLVAQAFAVDESNSLSAGTRLGGPWLYDYNNIAVLPNGSGIVTVQRYYGPGDFVYLQSYNISPAAAVTPTGRSLEVFATQIYVQNYVATQWGNSTIFGQFANLYRTFHLSPNGDIDPPSPSVYWDENGISRYSSKALGVSRDGRVVISAGSGNGIGAISHWIGDDGQVRELNRIASLYPEFSPGPNRRYVLFAPQRNWVFFIGDVAEMWSLHPDGLFNQRLWRRDDLGDDTHATISGDGRCVLLGSLTGEYKGTSFRYFRGLTILRLGPGGELLSTRVHETPGFPYLVPQFVIRRKPGDANGDGWIDIADVVNLVNHVNLGTEIPNPVDFDNADVDRDGDRDQVDVDGLVNLLLTN